MANKSIQQKQSERHAVLVLQYRAERRSVADRIRSRQPLIPVPNHLHEERLNWFSELGLRLPDVDVVKRSDSECDLEEFIRF